MSSPDDTTSSKWLWADLEGKKPHFSSLFFASWVGFIFLWRSWLLIEARYGLHTEYTRRVSSLDLVLAHLCACGFFVPMRYLFDAPSAVYNGLMYSGFVVFVIVFYFQFCFIKLNQSVLMQVVAMVMIFAYFGILFGAGHLGQAIVESTDDFPHVFWISFQFLAFILIVAKERHRVVHSDPLDYNYTHEQKRNLRNFEGKNSNIISSALRKNGAAQGNTAGNNAKGNIELEQQQTNRSESVNGAAAYTRTNSPPRNQSKGSSYAGMQKKNSGNGGLFGSSKPRKYGGGGVY